MDREKVIKGLETRSIKTGALCWRGLHRDILSMLKEQEEKMEHLNNIALEYEKEVFRLQILLKEQENEYEKGFNDAMHGKQELMYEGIDGKWHKKDW